MDTIEQLKTEADEKKAALAAARAAQKEAVANHKQAVAYRKSLPADGDAEAIEAADESVIGWAAEVDRAKAATVVASEESKAATAALKDARAEARAAGKTAGGRRSKLKSETVLAPVEGAEVSRGLASIVVGCFDGVKTYEEAAADVKEAFAAKHAEAPINSNVWLTNPDAYVDSHVRWWMSKGFLAEVAAS